jgi:hypothetical protein
MSNIGLGARILESGGETRGQPHLAINPSQQEGSQVRGQSAPRTIGTDRLASNRRKTELFCVRIAQKQTWCGFYGMDTSHIPFYQRLARGLCFFTKNSG